MGELFIYLLLISVTGLLFPVFVHADVYADIRENKCWFALGLYSRIKLFGGYLRIRRDGIAFHLSVKKAVLLPYSEMSDTRKRFEITKGFQVYRYHQIVEVGTNGGGRGILFAALVQSLAAQIYSVLQTAHPFLSLKNSTLLSEGRTLKITLRAVLVFNGLVLAVAMSKKILEALFNWIREKKSKALWKKRHSA